MDFNDERSARAALAYLFDPGPALHAVTREDGPVAACRTLSASGQLPAGVRSDLAGVPAVRAWARAAAAAQTAVACGRVVVPGDDDWPAGLADLTTTAVADGEDVSAVLCLFVHGTGPVGPKLGRSVAITGARAATAYGINVARDLAYGCTGAGWLVVACGGFGIDRAAHGGAVVDDGTTVVVQPGGLDSPHPHAHRSLFESIVERGGLLVSLWPPGTPLLRRRFLIAQRLLAQLTCGTVLVEAALRGGSLLTLAQARRCGKPAMVVPGPVTSALSAGCHQALRSDPQVRLVTTAAEVISELTATATAG